MDSFVLEVRAKAEQAAKEYTELVRECQRLDVRIERTRIYIDQLNNFVKEYGTDKGVNYESKHTLHGTI